MKSGIAWLAQVIVIATLVSAGVGLVRAQVSFLPGLSGLFVGALVGYLITATSRRVPLRYRAGTNLIWPALASAVLYVGVQHLVMGWHQASVVDSPLFWIREMFAGRGEEFYFSAGTSGAFMRIQLGALSGGSWIFFNVLDTVFFFCLCFVASLSASGGRVAKPSPAPMLAALAVLVSVTGGYALAWQLLEAAPPIRHRSPAELRAELLAMGQATEMTGRWRFTAEDQRYRRSLMAEEFMVEPAGRGEYRGTSLGQPYFRFSVAPRGRLGNSHSGLIWYLRHEHPSTEPDQVRGLSTVRMRYDPDRGEWVMVVSQPGDVRRSTLYRAVKVPEEL